VNGPGLVLRWRPQSSTRSSTKSSNTAPPSPSSATKPAIRRTFSNDQHPQNSGGRSRQGGHGHQLNVQLPPIPGSPYGTEVGTPPGTPRKSTSSQHANGKPNLKPTDGNSPNGRTTPTPASPTQNGDGGENIPQPTTPTRSRSKSSSHVPHRSPQPQSLNAAMEMISQSDTNTSSGINNSPRSTSESGHGMPSMAIDIPDVPRLKINGGPGTPTRTHIRIGVGSPMRDPWAMGAKRDMVQPSPQRSPHRALPAVTPRKGNLGVVGKEIGSPILNHGASWQCFYPVIFFSNNYMFGRSDEVHEPHPEPYPKPTDSSADTS